MHPTTLPIPLADALALPRTPGRSAEVFVDSDLELQFVARPTNGPQVPHLRDELYFAAAGSGRDRVEGQSDRCPPWRSFVLRRACGARLRVYVGGFLHLGIVLRPGNKG
jgi:hypothetical protein